MEAVKEEKGIMQEVGNGTDMDDRIMEHCLWNSFSKRHERGTWRTMGAGWLVIVVTPVELYARL